MADRTVTLRIGANITGLTSQLRAAQKSVQDFSTKSVGYIEKNSASISDLSTKVGVVGIGLTALATTAVTRFAQFDKAMSGVAATGEDARGSLDALRQAAIVAGADTAFSAEEAANAIEELAKAGLSAKDILGGGLDGALALAAAGGLAVADAAEIAATALTQFGLAGSDVPHVADLLAAGAGKAQGDVSDLSQALNQAGLIASQTGLSIEETTAGLSAFASAGLLGSDAGTSFKTMLQVLAAPSSTAAAEMERLGINAYDANGEFIGLQNVAGNLRTSLAGLTDEQKSSALATIFGSDAVRAASVLYNQGAVGVAAWTNAVDEQGYAAETARVQTDNLIGDLERLGGSLDSVFIQSGSGANTALRGIAQGAEAAVDAIGRLPEPVLNATTMIAGAGGLSLLGIAGLGKLAVSAGEVTEALRNMNIPLKNAAAAAGGLGTVLAGVGIGLSIMAQRAAESQGRVQQLAQTWTDAGNATAATTNLITESLSKQTANLADGNKTVIELADQVGVSTQDLIGYIEGESGAIERVNEQIAAHNDITGEWIGKALGQQTEAQNLQNELGTLSEEYARSKEMNELDARAKEAAAGSTGELADASGDAAMAVGDLTEAIEDQWQAMIDASGAVLSLRDAQRQAEAAYDDARESLKDNGKTLDEATAKGRANQAALDQIASSGLDLVDSLRASGASLKDVQGAMSTARERFIETATAMGMSKKEARELADQLNLIPKNVTTTATVDTAGAISAIGNLDETLNSINGKTVTASVAIKQYGQAAMATGGAVIGPGTGTSDDVPAMLSNGEHVWTAEEVRLAGGHGAMYAKRAALRGGAQFLAAGGAVGQSARDVDRWRRELEQARAERARAKDAERKASRTDSERDDRAADRLMKQAERRVDRAEKRLDDARARRGRLLEERADLRTSLRRGDLRDSVTGGLSSAIGVTDQLRDLANSGDVGSARARRLRATAGRGENALTSLYRQAERTEKRIENVRDRLEELQQVRAGVQSRVVDGFSLGDVRGDGFNAAGQRTTSGSALAAAAKQYAGKAKKFSTLMAQLQKKTRSSAIVQEVAGYGVEQGSMLAQSLLSDLPSLRSLASSYEAIERYGGYAGAAVARSVGGGRGIYEAQQAVNTAEAQAKAIDKRIAKWSRVFGRELASTLGIKARASGGSYSAGDVVLTGERGPELEVKQRAGYVLSAEATRRLATTGGQSYGMGGASTTYNSNLSVVTNRDVTPRALLRFDQQRRLLGVRG